MAQIVEGLLQHVDREHGQVVIGSETFEILQGLPWSAELVPGIHVQPYADEWAAIRRRCTGP